MTNPVNVLVQINEKCVDSVQVFFLNMNFSSRFLSQFFHTRAQPSKYFFLVSAIRD